MKNKIKSTTIYRYSYPVNKQKNDGTDQGQKYSTTIFDTMGNVLEELKFDEDGEIDDRIINTYNKEGKLIEMRNYFADDELAEHNTYERDDDGNIKIAFKHYQDGEKDTINYFRDTKGNLVKKATIDSFGEEESKETITYKNGKVNQRKVEEYDELTHEENFTYSKDMVLEEHSKWSVEDEDARFVNRFDEKGRIAKILKYNLKDDLLAKSEYLYNDNDTIKEIIEEFPGGKNNTQMEYDANKNLIKQTETNKQGNINNRVSRKYNKDNELIETAVEVNKAGTGVTDGYLLRQEYLYFD